MTSRRPRWFAAVALAAALTLSACGSDDEGSGLEAAASASPSAEASEDADGFTAEEREVVDAVHAYASAIFARGAEPVAESLKGKVTDQLYAQVVRDEQGLTEKVGKHRIGEAVFTPSAVTITAGTAEAQGCLDATNAFIVDKGQSEAGAGAIGGARSPLTIQLERVDDAWLVATPKVKEGSC
ncbi:MULTISPECIES: hypothetical protein [Mumia]|uniref:hypothetical protein n=1 Tax=Mumia TaxID=1546255 RepID=UPI00141DA5F1|nr:hypothetical protein [Mumia sp. ZJ1417]QMW68603.1 hypothetical protein H4N58_07440 [Mumia sp. ZJ1417]